MPSAKVLPLRPAASAPVRLEYRWERFSGIVREIAPLFARHHREVGRFQKEVPLDVDWDRFLALDAGGTLYTLTARDAGRMVGYTISLVSTAPEHQSTAFGIIETYWLDPAYREGWAGVRLLTNTLAGFKQLKVKVVRAGHLLHNASYDTRMARLFKRLGFVPLETVYVKLME